MDFSYMVLIIVFLAAIAPTRVMAVQGVDDITSTNNNLEDHACYTRVEPSHTTALNCPNLGLTGTVPAAVADLTLLTSLFLNANALTGTLSPALGDLTHLQLLGFYGNDLVGSIPPSLGKLTRLQKLYLANNKLTGTIPDLARLTDLREFNVFNNELSGSIPPFLGDLSLLTYLSMHSNQISGCVPENLAALCSAPGTRRSCMLLEQFEKPPPDVVRELEELTPEKPRRKATSNAKAVNACMKSCREEEGRRDCTHCIDLFYLF